jgi:hypothetical protein
LVVFWWNLNRNKTSRLQREKAKFFADRTQLDLGNESSRFGMKNGKFFADRTQLCFGWICGVVGLS